MSRSVPELVQQLAEALGLSVVRRDRRLWQVEGVERWLEAFCWLLPPAEGVVERTLGVWVAQQQGVISPREYQRRMRAYPRSIRVLGLYELSPGEDYDLWNRIIGKDFLRALVEGLRVYYNYSRVPVDADGLYSVLLDLYYHTALPLNRSDLQILSVLGENPLLSGRSLDRQTGLAHATVVHRLRRLRSRFDLRATFQLNYGRLGLERVMVYIPSSSLVIRSPYSLAGYLERCGVFWSFNSLAVPVGRTLSNLVKFLRGQVREGVIPSFQVYRNPEVKFFWNFKYYSVDNHTWEIPWDQFADQLNELERSAAAIQVDQNPQVQPRVRFKLSEVKYRVIWELGRGFQPSITALAKKLKVPHFTLRRLMATLQNQNIVRPYMYLVRVGLQRHSLIMFQAEQRFIKVFRSWSIQFPSSEIYRLENLQSREDGIIALVGIPRDGVYRMSQLLSRAGASEKLGFFVRQTELGLGRILPPLETKDQLFYNVEKGEWLDGSQDLFQLVELKKK